MSYIIWYNTNSSSKWFFLFKSYFDNQIHIMFIKSKIQSRIFIPLWFLLIFNKENLSCFYYNFSRFYHHNKKFNVKWKWLQLNYCFKIVLLFLTNRWESLVIFESQNGVIICNYLSDCIIPIIFDWKEALLFFYQHIYSKVF